MGDEIQKRPRGRPKEPVIGPNEIEQIGEMLAEGRTMRAIAREMGVSFKTIRHHVERSIVPILRQPLLRGPEQILNKYEHMYRACWNNINAGDKYKLGWMQLAFAIQQEISRFLRYTTAGGDTINILNTGTSVQGEFRRAGASWSEINEEVVDRLQKLIEDQRVYDAAAQQFLDGTQEAEEP